jgi:integrase
MAERLNAHADAALSMAGAVHGTTSWIVQRYQETPRYAKLAPSTKRHYDHWLRVIEEKGGPLPFAQAWTRRNVVDLVASYRRPWEKSELVAVLKLLCERARYHGLMTDNPTSERIDVDRNPARERMFSNDELARVLEALADEPDWLTTAFLLLRDIAQRPGDILAMTWSQYDGERIWLTQQKTGKRLGIKVLPELREWLDRVPARWRQPDRTIVANHRSRSGGAVKYRTFNKAFDGLCTKLGIDAQARDLRRSAMVQMSLAGVPTQQISSVSGHSIDATQKILDTYIPRTTELADAAIDRWATYRAGTKSNAFDK